MRLAHYYSSTLKMEAVTSSEMAILIYQATRRHTPSDCTLNTYVCLNVNSDVQVTLLTDPSKANGRRDRAKGRRSVRQKSVAQSGQANIKNGLKQEERAGIAQSV